MFSLSCLLLVRILSCRGNSQKLGVVALAWGFSPKNYLFLLTPKLGKVPNTTPHHLPPGLGVGRPSVRGAVVRFRHDGGGDQAARQRHVGSLRLHQHGGAASESDPVGPSGTQLPLRNVIFCFFFGGGGGLGFRRFLSSFVLEVLVFWVPL